MATHWVCKADGTVQCQENPEIPLEVMRAQLAAVIGDKEILRAEKRSHIVIRLCGFPTGRVNAYELTEHGYWLLTHGFIGPMGFALCDLPEAAVAASDSKSAQRDPDDERHGQLRPSTAAVVDVTASSQRALGTATPRTDTGAESQSQQSEIGGTLVAVPGSPS